MVLCFAIILSLVSCRLGATDYQINIYDSNNALIYTLIYSAPSIPLMTRYVIYHLLPAINVVKCGPFSYAYKAITGN